MNIHVNVNNREIFAKNLRYYMEKNDVKRMDLCQSLNLKYTTLREWTNGTAYPRIDAIEKLAAYFGITKSDLVEDHSSSGRQTVKGIRIPVLGEVHAGLPIDAVQDILDYEEITPQMAASGEFFALRIKGDCMEPKISDGDVIIVRCQQDADSGDVVVAAVNGDEAVCRKLMKYAEENGIALIPLNPAYAPIRYSAEDVRTLPVTIIGKAVELRSKL